MTNFQIASDSNLLDVLKHLNKSGNKLVLLHNEGKIVGLITDGDIRRALIQGAKLTDLADTVSKKDFIYASNIEDAKLQFSVLPDDIEFIPIINKFGELEKISYRSEVKNFPIATPALFNEEFEYLIDAFLSTWISSNGQYIDLLEENFSKFVGKSYGVSCSNGTAALHLALMALGIGPGDEVIVPNLTFAATINAVLHSGATPVIVDIDENNWGINPHLAKCNITDKTKAIIAVHLYGRPCSIDKISEICNQHNLYLIEDCAEAHGANFDGKSVGSFGDISCFSFFANKIMTTGEGGICVADDPALIAKMRQLRDHGMSENKRYWHEVIGYNYRMTNLQAAIGCAQLNKIETLIANRKAYSEMYSNSQLRHFIDFIPLDQGNVVWLASGLIKNNVNKIALINGLKSNGVECRPFFFPLSDMPLYKKYSKSNDYPVSRSVSERGISLPTYGVLADLCRLDTALAKFNG